jgi:hypothetical protein
MPADLCSSTDFDYSFERFEPSEEHFLNHDESSCSGVACPIQERVSVLPSKVFQDGEGICRVYPDSPTHWTAQSVLQWLGSLANAAETSGASPIVVNGVRLSEPSMPPVTSLAAHQGSMPQRVTSTSRGVKNQHTREMFRNMEIRDPAGWWSIRQMEAMAHLAEHSDLWQTGYTAIHTQFEYTFSRILEQSSNFGFESRYLLDSLYQETILKLQDLLDGTRSYPDKDELSGSADSPRKEDFAMKMTDWLVGNWTNPYPDEDGLSELASETDTHPTIVSNWLINARTRKWRPAIVKASTFLDRPASLLLEDSINIFKGLPLRTLEGDETSCSHDNFDHHCLLASAGALYPPTKRFKP